MCGIAGIINAESTPSEGAVRSMSNMLAHRGPDGEGIYSKGSVCLGHRRLAIIDIDGGTQPMADNSGNLHIVYNGELYNFRELREELVKAGYDFRTNSDTEVILASYSRWGVDCLNKLNGMFAFAIADFRNEQLFLARDHAGIKPLYYRLHNRKFAFASELGSLLQADMPAPEISLQSVDYYLRRYYVPAPYTIYENISKLPPGHALLTGFDLNTIKTWRYWRIDFPQEVQSTEQILDEVEGALKTAVRRSLISDVPIGVFCSGGIDSTLISMLASEEHNGISAFSIGYKEEAASEIPYARTAAATLGLDLHSRIIQEDSLNDLPLLVGLHGEPFGDSSCIPTYHVSKLARERVTVALSGDGGDELFGGYARYFKWTTKTWLQRHLAPGAFWRNLRAGGITTPRAVADQLGFGPERWSGYKENTPLFRRMFLWRKEHQQYALPPLHPESDTYSHARTFDGMAYPQAMDFETYLTGDVLTKVDIASMANGLEVRPPFLDKDVIKAATKLPEHLKYTDGSSGKKALQKLLLRRFKPKFLQRPKAGFAIPEKEWFAPGGRARAMLQERLTDAKCPLQDWFKPEAIDDTLNNPNHGSRFLWLMLALSEWAMNHNSETKVNIS